MTSDGNMYNRKLVCLVELANFSFGLIAPIKRRYFIYFELGSSGRNFRGGSRINSYCNKYAQETGFPIFFYKFLVPITSSKNDQMENCSMGENNSPRWEVQVRLWDHRDPKSYVACQTSARGLHFIFLAWKFQVGPIVSVLLDWLRLTFDILEGIWVLFCMGSPPTSNIC